MTGEALQLASDQVAIYSKGVQYQAGQTLTFDEKEMEVVQVLPKNVTLGHLPDHMSFIVSQYLVIVVQDRRYLKIKLRIAIIWALKAVYQKKNR